MSAHEHGSEQREQDHGEHATRERGGDLGRRLPFAVGTFLVVGAGFVFTLFFVSSLAGSGEGGFVGGVLGGVGATLGYGFAILLSPLVALFVGVVVGRDGRPRAAVDAAVGSAAGFLVMFFVTLVLASSLGATGTDGGVGVGAGPLLGFTVGVGLTGAGGALVARHEGSLLESVTDHELRRPALFGLAVFTAFGVGYAVTVFLAESLAGSEGSIGLEAFGFGSVTTALGLGLLLSPLLAVLVGSAVGTGDEDREPATAAGAGGVAASLGVVGMLVVLYVLVLVLEPAGTAAGDFPLGPLLGFVVGTGLTGAGASYVSEL